jgi:hypothetical protein
MLTREQKQGIWRALLYEQMAGGNWEDVFGGEAEALADLGLDNAALDEAYEWAKAHQDQIPNDVKATWEFWERRSPC